MQNKQAENKQAENKQAENKQAENKQALSNVAEQAVQSKHGRGLMRFTTSTVYENSEEWTSPLPQSAVLKSLAAAFEGHGARIRREDDRVEVRFGSAWRFRLGRKRFSRSVRIPVAVEFRSRITADGTVITAHAFDTLGSHRANASNRTPSDAESAVTHRLDELLGKAAAALGVERPAPRKRAVGYTP